jgi:4'-phosphopantetheinyl transferase
MDVPLWYRETAHDNDIAAGHHALSPEEAARAGRFLRAEDRRDYIIAHSLLREALSQYQPAYAPDVWRFETNCFGKPSISRNHLLGGPMEFSLSHTRGFVACAVAPVRIGIDVEWLDREVEMKDIVEHHFSASEAASLNRLPAEERRDRFFQLWTLKEAFFKALGCGISGHLDTAVFDLENPVTINFQAPHGIRVPDWQFALFLPHPRIRMAIALESAQPVRFITASVKAA